MSTEKLNIKISIVIPVFNSEEYLANCLISIIEQDLKDIEIICIDDGSTDNSIEVLKYYQSVDTRIKIIQQQNQGSGKSRNIGIDGASGEYIMFIDSDDYLPTENTLRDLYVAAKTNNAKICGGSFSVLRDNGIQTTFSGIQADYVFENQGMTLFRDFQFDYGYHRFIYNRKLLTENKIYFPDLTRFQDPPFFVNAMIQAQEFYAIKEITYRYRAGHQRINWTSKKINDLVKGISQNLEISSRNDLSKLHRISLYRLESEYLSVIMKQLKPENTELLQLLIEINQKVNVRLLNQENVNYNEGYVIMPLRILLYKN